MGSRQNHVYIGWTIIQEASNQLISVRFIKKVIFNGKCTCNALNVGICVYDSGPHIVCSYLQSNSCDQTHETQLIYLGVTVYLHNYYTAN